MFDISHDIFIERLILWRQKIEYEILLRFQKKFQFKQYKDLGETENIPQFGGPWFASVGIEGIVIVNMTCKVVNATESADLSLAVCELKEDILLVFIP